jgi:hypothetical protein
MCFGEIADIYKLFTDYGTLSPVCSMLDTNDRKLYGFSCYLPFTNLVVALMKKLLVILSAYSSGIFILS